ncbi:MAG: hypothetical protein HY799_02070 [Nitrosomonadales bacterium]|nr:hypothetical protein [Nitrosomonadales bacterium]
MAKESQRLERINCPKESVSISSSLSVLRHFSVTGSQSNPDFLLAICELLAANPSISEDTFTQYRYATPQAFGPGTFCQKALGNKTSQISLKLARVLL